MTRYNFGYPGDMYYMIFSMVVIECYWKSSPTSNLLAPSTRSQGFQYSSSDHYSKPCEGNLGWAFKRPWRRDQGMPYLFTIDLLFIFLLEGCTWQDLINNWHVDRSKSVTIHGCHCSLDQNKGNTDSRRATIRTQVTCRVNWISSCSWPSWWWTSLSSFSLYYWSTFHCFCSKYMLIWILKFCDTMLLARLAGWH